MGVPSDESEYWKLTLLAPAGIVKGGAGVNVPVLELLLRCTARAFAASTRLSKASTIATVIVPDSTPAVRVCGAVVNTSWLAAAGMTVSCCVVAGKPVTAAVMTGVPAAASVYWKLTVPAPAGIVSGDVGANVLLLDVLFRFTVTALAASIRLPNESSNARVIVPEATPAVSVCGDVVNTSWLAAAGLTVSFCVADPTPLSLR